jgi:hypothetical protein
MAAVSQLGARGAGVSTLTIVLIWRYVPQAAYVRIPFSFNRNRTFVPWRHEIKARRLTQSSIKPVWGVLEQ